MLDYLGRASKVPPKCILHIISLLFITHNHKVSCKKSSGHRRPHITVLSLFSVSGRDPLVRRVALAQPPGAHPLPPPHLPDTHRHPPARPARVCLRRPARRSPARSSVSTGQPGARPPTARSPLPARPPARPSPPASPTLACPSVAAARPSLAHHRQHAPPPARR
jgi:hypothetical protein